MASDPPPPVPSPAQANYKQLLRECFRMEALLTAPLPKAKKDNKLSKILSDHSYDKNAEEGLWRAFNDRTDTIFGNRVFACEGATTHIERGEHGIIIALAFFKAFSDLPLPFDIAVLKVQRVHDELQRVFLENAAESKKVKAQKKKDKEARKPGEAATLTSLPPRGKAARKLNYAEVHEDGLPHNETESSQSGGPAPRSSAIARVGKTVTGPNQTANDSHDNQAEINEAKDKEDAREELSDSSGDEYEDQEEEALSEEDIIYAENEQGEMEEEVGPSDAAVALKRKRSQAKSAAPKPSKKVKTAKAHTRTTRAKEAVHGGDIGSEESSDGEGAMRKVKETEAADRQGHKGPVNTARSKFYAPVQGFKNGRPRWVFKCMECKTSLTFPRTEGVKSFDDEHPQPKINNLAGHRAASHPKSRTSATSEQDGHTPTAPPASLEVTPSMQDNLAQWLAAAEENPTVGDTYKNFLRHFVAFLVSDDLPFIAGERQGLIGLWKFLKVKHPLPVDTTIRNNMAKLYIELHAILVEELTTLKSRIAYSHDAWTNRQMIHTFAGIIAHFIDHTWTLHERAIDFHPLADDEHQGRFAAKAFVESASKRGGLNKMLAITMDNAFTNNVLARTLEPLLMKRYEISFKPENSRIGCLAHDCNLIVQAMLHVLDEAPSSDESDHFKQNKMYPTHYDPSEDPDHVAREAEDYTAVDRTVVRAEEDEIEALVALCEETGPEAQLSAIKKLREIVKKITSSPQRRNRFRTLARECYPDKDVAELMVIRDIMIRWNSTHAMGERGLVLQKAIDEWVQERRSLSHLTLDREDWKFIQQFCNLLYVFTEVTLKISQKGVPSLPYVIPMYSLMESHLTTASTNKALKATVQTAAKTGLLKLQGFKPKVYAREPNWLAHILHPYYRLRWLRKENLHVKAEIIFRHVYQVYKEEHTASVNKNAAPSASSVSTVHTSQSKNALQNFMGLDKEDAVTETVRDELQEYLGFQGGGGEESDPLGWWKLHEKEFPVIAAMALDYLAIPAASVSVERMFSASRHLCSDSRASLNPETINQAMCIKLWLKDGFLQALNIKEYKKKQEEREEMYANRKVARAALAASGSKVIIIPE